MYYRSKGFIIIFLVFLAIYQTSRLWFEDFSNHSFFYLMKNSDRLNIQREIKNIEESILINCGNNKFIRKYNNISNSDHKKIFDEVIYLCIKNGDYSYIEEFDINQILDNKSIIYTYDYFIENQDMLKIFNIKNNNLYKIKRFNMIAILPSASGIKTVFIDSNKLNAYGLEITKQSLNQNIYNIINDFINIDNKDFYFISTLKSGINLFKENNFIPKAKNDTFNINKIIAKNPLEKDGGVLLSSSEKYIDIFFDNPTIKWNSFINNTYTYNDENTVVKYYTNGVLEYVSYKSKLTNFKDKSPYSLAISFLEKDSNIKNEYYLKDYKINNNDIIFYFDYKINNFPIILSNNKKNETGMNSMIEITVSDNKVSKYKRLIYDFMLDLDYSKIEKNFIEIIDKVILKRTEEGNLEEEKINEMKLVYSFDRVGIPIDLCWLVNINNKNYFENTE